MVMPMCTFKFCKQSGKCFLSKSSPCPKPLQVVDSNRRLKKANTPAQRSQLRYNGFLDRGFIDDLHGSSF